MKYFCYYDTKINRRNMQMAAVNKVNYICSALNAIGIKIALISCSMVAPNKMPKCTETINESTTIHYFKAKRNPSLKILKTLELFRRNIVLFFFILKNVKKNETILVYHSLASMRCFYYAKKIKRFKLLLEVEEIYNDVYQRSLLSKKIEQKFMKSADMYMFPTQILAIKINTLKKPEVILHGTYEIPQQIRNEKKSGKIQIAYTGSFDPMKGGLITSLNTALYLDSRYCLNILGIGSNKVVDDLKAFIQKHSLVDACEIKYDGLLQGKEYTDYLQKCDIGLSTQNPNAPFNLTSFPSKVMSYLSCGLRVVTYPICVLKESKLNSCLYYYTDDTAESIANVIKSIDFNKKYDSKILLQELDLNFKKDLKELLK